MFLSASSAQQCSGPQNEPGWTPDAPGCGTSHAASHAGQRAGELGKNGIWRNIILIVVYLQRRLLCTYIYIYIDRYYIYIYICLSRYLVSSIVFALHFCRFVLEILEIRGLKPFLVFLQVVTPRRPASRNCSPGCSGKVSKFLPESAMSFNLLGCAVS